MKILLVSPMNPQTFWSFRYAIQFTDRKAAHAPLGLLTVASLLPKAWEKKLIDMNTDQLEDEDIRWADYVFLGAMDIQQKSALEVIDHCKKLGIKIVAGGPFFTENHERFEDVDHLVLGEAEITLPEFLKDLENGTPKHLYLSKGWADLEKSPAPMWELLKPKNYTTMSMQYSRGCPFNCEFCQITQLFGRNVRTKTKEQIIKELDFFYNTGWREGLFIVDDNFIGNKQKVKTEILPAITEWMEKRGYPFDIHTQASMNLADDEELMRMMVRAGFNSVFVGIETIDDDCLAETGKFQNRNRDLVENVKKMQRFGLEVWSGFIMGFDSDKESIFDRMAEFIQESGITIALIGMLTPLKGTKLYERLKRENRLISETTESDTDFTTDFTINFIPKMNRDLLLEGYRKVLKNVYSPEYHYSRLLKFLKEYNPHSRRKTLITFERIRSFIKIIFILGILDRGRAYFWRLFFWTARKRPQLLSQAVTLWVKGYHLRKAFGV